MEISLSISFRKRNILKIDTPFGTLARQLETLEAGWQASMLARKPRWRTRTLAGRPRWHACTYDTRFSKLVFNNFLNGIHERDKHL